MDGAQDEPLSVIAYTRAWGWGLVIVSTPEESDLPIGDLHLVSVTANDKAVCFAVRPYHAVDFADGVEEVPFATAEVVVETYGHEVRANPGRKVIFDGTIATPTAWLSVGDAEGEVRVEAHPVRTRVRLSIGLDDDPDEAAAVWMELLPMG